MNSSKEFFNTSNGFSLISGMSYKLSARVPTVDMNGQLFFTAKSVRDWTYGLENIKYDKFIFE